MSMNLGPEPFKRYFDSSGDPLAGGLLYSYAAGTTTPQNTYTDINGGTANANPIVLDANGYAGSVWLDPTLSYKFVLKTAAGATIATEDNIVGLLNNDSVPTAALQASSVTTAKIADDAVTAAKLADSASTDASRAVTSDHIRDAAITGIKLAASASNAGGIANLGLTATAGSNALTIALTTSAGATASATDSVRIGFRSSTVTSGVYNLRSVTAALSTVISSGSTAGHVSAIAEYLYVYAIDNAGTVELAWSSKLYDDGSVVSTTAEGGAGAADSRSVMYSTTARSNVPCRLLGRLSSTQATAGTWVTAIAEITLAPFIGNSVITGGSSLWRVESAQIDGNAVTPTIARQSGNWISSITRNAQGDYTINIPAGVFAVAPIVAITRVTTNGYTRITNVSTTAIQYFMTDTGGAGQDFTVQILAHGPR